MASVHIEVSEGEGSGSASEVVEIIGELEALWDEKEGLHTTDEAYEEKEHQYEEKMRAFHETASDVFPKNMVLSLQYPMLEGQFDEMYEVVAERLVERAASHSMTLSRAVERSDTYGQ